MVQLFAFCRSLRKVSLHATALALCSAAVVASVTPASARPHHGAAQQAGAHHVGHHAHHHYRHHPHRHIARGSRWERGVAKMPHGNPIVVSGNNGNRVREAPVSRGRIYAYVMPN